jgi:hypothetical protein
MDRFIAMSFAHGTFVNPQEARSRQRSSFLHLSSRLCNGCAGDALPTGLNKAGTDPSLTGNLSNATGTGELPQVFSQPCCGTSSPPTGCIPFRKGLSTHLAAKSPLPQKQLDLIPSQWQVAFASGTTIVDALTYLLAMRAGRACVAGDDFQTDTSILLPILPDDAQLQKIQWNHDALLFLLLLVYGMLATQGLSSCFIGVLVLTNENEGQVFHLPFSPPPPKGWRPISGILIA